MSTDLERRSLLPISRNSGRELAKIREEQLAAQAAVHAQESVVAYQAYCKIENGYELASHTVRSASQLNWEVTQATRDNPALEMQMRALEQDVFQAARSVVCRYMR